MLSFWINYVSILANYPLSRNTNCFAYVGYSGGVRGDNGLSPDWCRFLGNQQKFPSPQQNECRMASASRSSSAACPLSVLRCPTL